MHDLQMIIRLNREAAVMKAARVAKALNGYGQHPKDAEKGRSVSDDTEFGRQAAETSRRERPRRQMVGALGATIE